MPEIVVTFGLTTPAFAGGAGGQSTLYQSPRGPEDRPQKCTDGLRPPTIKALLRFWWRASQPSLSPTALEKAEAEIFGAAGRYNKRGRIIRGQRLVIVPKGCPTKVDVTDLNEPLPENDLAYLAYGPVQFGQPVGEQTRGNLLLTQRLGEGNTLTATLRFSSHKDDILKALWLLSAFGGVGSRNRRGWGGLQLGGDDLIREWRDLGLDDPHGARDRDALKVLLAHGLGTLFGPRSAMFAGVPEHTAFTKETRLFLGQARGTWVGAMNALKTTYEQYRRALGAWRNHETGAVGPDHALRTGWIRRMPWSTDPAPKGAAFGLPLGAKFTAGPQVNTGVGADLNGRRASPVFFHVIRCGGKFVPLVLWLPARFLGPNSEVHVEGPHGTASVQDPSDEAITEFLDGDPTLTCYPGGARWTGLAVPTWQEVGW